MSVIGDPQKLDFLWKMSRSVGMTSQNKAYFEEAILNASLEIGSEHVWTEDTSIPDPAPLVSTSVVEVRSNLVLTVDPSISGNRVHLACDTLDDPSTRLDKWIPTKYGRSYHVKLYEDDGSGGIGPQVYITDPIGWFFSETGVLFCMNDPELAGKVLPFHLVGYRYVGLRGIPPGALGDKTYTHVQVVAGPVWTIDHNLGKNPSFTLHGPDGPLEEDDFDYPSNNRLIITFLDDLDGTAQLN